MLRKSLPAGGQKPVDWLGQGLKVEGEFRRPAGAQCLADYINKEGVLCTSLAWSASLGLPALICPSWITWYFLSQALSYTITSQSCFPKQSGLCPSCLHSSHFSDTYKSRFMAHITPFLPEGFFRGLLLFRDSALEMFLRDRMLATTP